jgi:hypothetical protein
MAQAQKTQTQNGSGAPVNAFQSKAFGQYDQATQQNVNALRDIYKQQAKFELAAKPPTSTEFGTIEGSPIETKNKGRTSSYKPINETAYNGYRTELQTTLNELDGRLVSGTSPEVQGSRIIAKYMGVEREMTQLRNIYGQIAECNVDASGRLTYGGNNVNIDFLKGQVDKYNGIVTKILEKMNGFQDAVSAEFHKNLGINMGDKDFRKLLADNIQAELKERPRFSKTVEPVNATATAAQDAVRAAGKGPLSEPQLAAVEKYILSSNRAAISSIEGESMLVKNLPGARPGTDAGIMHIEQGVSIRALYTKHMGDSGVATRAYRLTQEVNDTMCKVAEGMENPNADANAPTRKLIASLFEEQPAAPASSKPLSRLGKLALRGYPLLWGTLSATAVKQLTRYMGAEDSALGYSATNILAFGAGITAIYYTDKLRSVGEAESGLYANERPLLENAWNYAKTGGKFKKAALIAAALLLIAAPTRYGIGVLGTPPDEAAQKLGIVYQKGKEGTIGVIQGNKKLTLDATAQVNQQVNAIRKHHTEMCQVAGLFLSLGMETAPDGKLVMVDGRYLAGYEKDRNGNTRQYRTQDEYTRDVRGTLTTLGDLNILATGMKEKKDIVAKFDAPEAQVREILKNAAVILKNRCDGANMSDAEATAEIRDKLKTLAEVLAGRQKFEIRQEKTGSVSLGDLRNANRTPNTVEIPENIKVKLDNPASMIENIINELPKRQ